MRRPIVFQRPVIELLPDVILILLSFRCGYSEVSHALSVKLFCAYRAVQKLVEQIVHIFVTVTTHFQTLKENLSLLRLIPTSCSNAASDTLVGTVDAKAKLVALQLLCP
jgi:hypothetical protein